MTAPTSETTPRPWTAEAYGGGLIDPDDQTGGEIPGVTWGGQEGLDASVPNGADALLIVYAVNNIERLTAERDEARAMLAAVVERHDDFTGHRCRCNAHLDARAFLARTEQPA